MSRNRDTRQVFKVTIDGVLFECPTMAHAIEIYHRLKGRKSRKETGSPYTAGVRAGLDAFGAKEQGKPTDLLENGAGQLILALRNEREGLETGELAEALRMDRKSLPPLILGLKRKARALGFEFDTFIARETRYEKGRPISRYKLTDEGFKVLFEGTEDKSP